MGDGSPFGFDVYDVKGAKFTDHYFVDCTSQKCHKVNTDYVMRAYLSSDVYGGDSTGDGKVYESTTHKESHLKYFKFYDAGETQRRLHVNVFNGAPDTWTLELYINGTKAGNLTWHEGVGTAWANCSPTEIVKVKDSNGNITAEYGPFTWETDKQGDGTTINSPWYPSAANSQDWWYISYIINETRATSNQTTNGTCHHMWYYELTPTQLDYINKKKFYIKAIHKEFGVTKTYQTSKIFTKKDHNGYINYNAKNE